MNRSDNRIRQAVIRGLKLHPHLKAEGVLVEVDQGMVTLSGHVHSLADKRAVGQIVMGVHGVKTVAFDLHVLSPDQDNDAKIAAEIANLLTWDDTLSKANIQAMVDDAWVTLEGEVKDHCQKVAAFNAISNIKSIKGISNRIVVKG